MKCLIHDLSPSYCYKKFNCRCEICRGWKSKAEEPRREKARERSRRWRLENTERSRENAKRYQKNNPEKLLEWQLKKYGLTPAEFYAMGDRCHICGKEARGMQYGKKRLVVDHDHSTGKVRGLLCGSCNIGLGHFQHDSVLLQNAIGYLQNGDVY